MQIDEIRIDGFGTLAQVGLSRLDPGLNVVHGANGSGKSTIVRFLRGMLAGFAEARQLRLLPALKGASSGGALGVHTHSGRFEIIRQGRADHSDTLAINLLQGSGADAAGLRQALRAIPVGVLRSVFFVTGPEAVDLSVLVQAALADNIPLAPTRRESQVLTGRIQQIEQERGDLFQGTPPRGSLREVELQRDRLGEELGQARRRQAAELAEWREAVQRVDRRIAQLEEETTWTHAVLQSAQCDLSETQSRLWESEVVTVQETERVERPPLIETAAWAEEIENIDRQIAHAQQVLRDLAASRMQVSVEQAGLTAAETPDPQAAFARQRLALTGIERRTSDLLAAMQEMNEGLPYCRCGDLRDQLMATLPAIREHLWDICRDLSRQQSSQQQGQFASQRDGIDRCELELTRQIQRLRIRRDQILEDASRCASDRLHFPDDSEHRHCACEGHADFVAELPPLRVVTPQAAQIVVRQRTIARSLARPGDAERETQLRELRDQLFAQWQQAQQRLRDARAEAARLNDQRDRIAADPSVQNLRSEFAAQEQQLADGREQWHALALLQEVLQRTRVKLEEEVPAAVIVAASKLLCRMTDGRYTRFVFDSQQRELRIFNNTGAELHASALSRGTLEQAALCFRLALCREYTARGLELPLVLDDILADTDEERLRLAVDVLIEFSQEHQIIVFTCQDALLTEVERRGIVPHNLPGSRRAAATASRIARIDEGTPAPAADPHHVSTRPLDRVNPDEPFWLSAESPVSYVPSLGEQMARRLGALGVRTVGDLVELDPETTEIPLAGLQISAATLRTWQSESRLLSCVPHLTGRDAQVLVACGILTPAELTEADVATLRMRIQRLQAENPSEYTLSWLSARPEWPTKETVESWVRNGRAARRWQRVREFTARGMRVHRGDSGRQPRSYAASPRNLFGTSRASRGPASEAATGSSLVAEADDREWRYFLTPDSPIVDAPSIGPRSASRLQRIGVRTVSEFLQRSAEDLATELDQRTLPAETIREWQQQSELMCRLPEMRGHDVQVLIACGLTDVEAISRMTPEGLFAAIEPFVTSRAGQRLLRSAKTPDREEVAEWIESARHAQLTRAA